MADRKSTEKKPLKKRIASFFRKNKRVWQGLAAAAGVVAFVLLVYLIHSIVTTATSTAGVLFELNEETGTYTVTGYEGDSENVLIARTHKGRRVTTVGREAFRDNTAIKSVRMMGIETIEDAAFAGCTALERLTFPKRTLKTIGNYAFSACEAITKIDMPDTVTKIGKYAFANTKGVKSLSISKGLTEIPEGSFSGLTELRNPVTIPDAVQTIGTKAFYLDCKVRSFKLGKSVQTIGDYAFAGTRGDKVHYTSISLPDSLREIGLGAFMYATWLKEITIPSGVTVIPVFMCYGDTALTRVTFKGPVREIHDYAFEEDENLVFFSLPDTIEFIGCRAMRSTVWMDNQRADGNGFIIVNGILMGYTGDAVELTTPATGVKQIYAAAYLTHTIESVVIPSGDTRIIGKMSMSNNDTVKRVVIGEGVTTLKDSAFYYNSSLEYVVLPSTLTVIEDNVFQKCDALQTIYFAGTAEQWNAITKGEENTELNLARVVVNSTGPEDVSA